jgi:hypothetical protein
MLLTGRHRSIAKWEFRMGLRRDQGGRIKAGQYHKMAAGVIDASDNLLCKTVAGM